MKDFLKKISHEENVNLFNLQNLLFLLKNLL